MAVCDNAVIYIKQDLFNVIII